VSIPPFRAGIFKASGSTDPMRIWKQRKEQVPALLCIVSISPPGYPSAWLRPRRARFRFARQDHCSSATSIGLNFRMPRHSGTIAKAGNKTTSIVYRLLIDSALSENMEFSNSCGRKSLCEW
jgi:hypothetical protein